MLEPFERIRGEASRRLRRIVYTESEEARVLEAVTMVSKNRLAHPLLVGNPSRIKQAGLALGLNLKNVEVVGRDSRRLVGYVEMCLPEWKAQGVGQVEAMNRLRNTLEYAVAMVRAGDADGLVAGPVSGRADDQRGLVQSTGLGGGRSAFSQCFVVFAREAGPQGGLLFANPATKECPSAQQLAEVAIGAAMQTRRLLAVEPHVAFLSVTASASLQARNRFKSVEEILVERVASAVETVRVREESLSLETRLWRGIEPHAGIVSDKLAHVGLERPNTFVFAEEQAAGLGHRLNQLFDDARTVGPIYDGLAHAANELEVGCDVEDIVDMTAITALG